MNTSEISSARYASLLTVGLVLLSGGLMLSELGGSLLAGLCFSFYVFSPLLVTVLLTFTLKRRSSQIVLLGSIIGYAVLFLVFYLISQRGETADAQYGMGLVMVPVYSIPCMLGFWIAAAIVKDKSSKPGEQ